jgi:signal transduction histidine kinase
VQQLWERWQSMNTAVRLALRSELLMVGGEPVVALWEVADGAMQAVVATPQFVESEWLATLVPLLEEQRVRLELRALDGRAVQAAGTRGAVVVTADAPVATRAAEETALPWRLAVTGLDAPGQGASFILRRRLLISGFALLMTMALVAGVVIVRAVARELAVVRLQSDFVAAVSHEFRTPLTTLRQFTDMLRDNRSMDDQRRQVCYDAQSRATDRLTRLVESLLDFGRMEAGAHRYAFGRCDVTALVRRVVIDFRDQASTTSRDVMILATESVEASVDEEALSRALWNLLDNAVKYSPEGSGIEVMVTGDEYAVRIAVRDYGLGIPARERRQVFAKFHRGEEARQRGIKGTGLGLAMVNEIVKAHHGAIELESAPGQGSTFTIVLPVAERHIDDATDASHPSDFEGHQAAVAHRTAVSEP